MARQQVERVVDDLDGSEAGETLSFGLDGASYEIDLSKKNAAGLRKVLARYIDVARTSRGGRPKATSRPKKVSPRKKNGRSTYEIAELREWAGANKIKVPARGRIPHAVVEQYLSSR